MNQDSHVYKTVEITGTSKKTEEDAVRQALARASKSVRNMRWFQVTETRGTIENGSVGVWQVTIKVGFTLDE